MHPRRVLEHIFISRAFTAYQLFSLVRDRLDEALNKYGSKLIILSNVIDRFIDPDVPSTEAKDLLVRICLKLKAVARSGTIVVTAQPFHYPSKHSIILEAVLFGKASVILSLNESCGCLNLTLEKHPKLKPFNVKLTGTHVSLTDFLEV